MSVQQTSITLPGRRRGCHLITSAVQQALQSMQPVTGIIHIFLQHTSASLTINENVSPDVREDLDAILDHLVPEGASYYQHTYEGRDDMPAHAKSSLIGASLTVPITGGQLNLGTWQGIYLCEHRDRGGARNVVLTVTGE